MTAAPAQAATPTPGPTPSQAATPESAAGAKAGACPDYEYIGARGSGEDNGMPAKKRYTAANPTLGMGGPVSDVYKRVSSTATADGVTMVPYAVPYPAVGIDVVGGDALIGGDLSVYSKSVELGAHAAAAELERVSRACPRTGVIVAGYSQGAQAMVEAVLSATPSARRSIVAAVFFGNTYFNSADTADDYGTYLPGLDGYLVSGSTAKTDAAASATAGTTSATGSRTKSGSDWHAKFDGAPIFDYCHNGDPICGLVDERTVGGVAYPVREFADVVASNSDETGGASIFTHHTDYQRGDTANAAQQLRFALGLPLLDAAGPAARITAPRTTEVGAETRFSGSGSLSDPADPIVSYRWSVDSGKADARVITTARPILSMRFREPGAHTIALRTTTLAGRSARSLTVTLTATPAPLAAPAAPRKVTATPGDGASLVTWPAVKGAEFYAVRDGDGTLLTAFTPLVPGQQQVSWTDTGLANGKQRSYRVYAVNSMGRSAASATVEVTPQPATKHASLTTVRLPSPPTTLVDPELVWALGLGLMVLALAVALVKDDGTSRPRKPRR